MKVFQNIEPNVIVGLILNCAVVAIFQGRSEAGPRALGNRSILFNPLLYYGKEYVNRIKKREKWRPFAGVVSLDDVNQWFDIGRLNETPFMTYAVNVKKDANIGGEKFDLHAITHSDGTCRVQTVTEEQNKHLHALLMCLKEQNYPPILGNTSFNLAGEPLVETYDEAINTLKNSELEFLYLPESAELIYIANETK
jgi:carbamoyltransferase